jgi:hypothetical protein
MKHSPAAVRRRSSPAFAQVLLGLIALVSALATSCSDGFGKPPKPLLLVVELDQTAVVGSAASPLPLVVGKALPFKFKVTAVNAAGNTDTTFNRYVRISSKPGAIDPLTGPDTDGRNVLLKNGASVTLEARITNAYGTTYIVADDLGYVPADPLRDPPPACSNGIDDDGDGKIDFPADEGCAFANDDDERGGTYSEGASAPIYFALPRIADVRGLTCEPTLGCSGNGTTPYPREQIQLDTGVRDDGSHAFDIVVTRISADGFYVSDLGDTRGTPPGSAGFNSIFAFNFNAPPRMRTCDRMKTYGGTANEFFGFTQISYPTWTLEEWDPSKRICLVPDPERLTPSLIKDTASLLRRSASFVRVETAPDGSQKAKVTPKFGPGDVPKTPGGLYAPTPDASNCDFDKNGKITFAAGNPENDCNAACTADPECTEWSNFTTRSTFRITVTDSNGSVAAVQADATASAGFDPVAMKGKELRHFAGTLHFFSGGAQYTIQARCKNDIIAALTEAPFGTDKACTTDDQCLPAAGLPPDFKCVALRGGGKGCRKLDPTKPDVSEPPPLACVFPRTFIDNNPQ